jgi:hypothetical protein
MDNKLNANEGITINFNAGTAMEETSLIHGHYEAVCRDADGNELWRDGFDNVVTYAGQNQLLLQITGNTTVVGPYMGLIGNSTTGPVVGDTQLSHAGWTEAGNPNTPTYSGARPTIAFSAPVNGNLVASATGNFTFTGSGNVTGAFMVFSTGATSVVGNTSGVLLSAGNLSAAQPVISTNVLSISYSIAL